MRCFKVLGVILLSVFIVFSNIPFVFTQSQSGGSKETSSQTLKDLLSESGKIIPDTESNSILVIDQSPNIALIEDYLKMADKPSQQILIEAKVLEVSLDKEHSLGVTWKLWKDGGLDIGSDATLGSAAGSALEQQIPFRNPNYKPISGSSAQDPFTIGIFDDNIEVILKALTTELDTDVLSAPKIATKNNRRAKINVATTVPYLAGVEKEDTETAGGASETTFTYEYEYADEGVSLEVTPLINPDRSITLNLYPEVKEITRFVAQVTPEGASGTPELPETDIRVTQTKVTVKEGQTVVIGGLIKEKTSHGITKIPLLGDIPFLGNLFKSTKEEKEKTELLILVSPKIIGTEEAEKIKKREIEREKIGEEARKKQREIQRQNQQRINSLYRQAKTAYSEENLDQAEAVFEQILEIDSEHNAAQTYLRTHIPNKRQQLKKVVQREKKRQDRSAKEKTKRETGEKKQVVKDLYAQGVSSYEKGDYRQAYKKFCEVEELIGNYKNVDNFLKVIPRLIKIKNRENKVNKALNILQNDTK